MRKESSSDAFVVIRGLTFAGILLAAAAPAGLAQEEDFFEEGSSYFQSETVEGASKHAEAPGETPATVTVIGREDIERYGFRTVADVLNYASVGSFTNYDRRYDFVGGRGLFTFEDFNTRILIMLDGHPLNEPWNNFAGAGREMAVPLDLVERVEIIYGPSSLLYGGYSLYGIINLVTRTGASLSGGRLRLSGGSWSTEEAVASYGLSGETAAAEGAEPVKWDVFLAGGHYQSDGERLDVPAIEVEYGVDESGSTTYGGRSIRTEYERAPFGFLYAKRGNLSLFARSGYRKHGQPLAPYESAFGTPRNYVYDDKSFAELRWDHPITSRLSVTARLFRDNYEYREHDVYFDSESYPGRSGYDYVLGSKNDDTGGELRLAWRAGTHLLTAGGEYRERDITQYTHYQFFHGGIAPDSAFSDDIEGHLAVLYVQEEWRPIEQLSIIAGGNWADTEPGGSKALPRLALIYKPARDLSVKALYGKGFRPPSIYEAVYTDFFIQIDNPSLRSEEITSTELSLLWNATPRLSLQGYLFDSKLKGLIQGTTIEDPEDVEGGVLPPGGDPADLVGLLQFQVAGDVQSRGAGATLRLRRSRARGYANLAYTRARLDPREGPETDLPASSNWIASAGASFDAGDFIFSTTARYVGEQDLEPSHGPGTAGDFFDANLRVVWKIWYVLPLTFTLDIWNLFDSQGNIAASSIYSPPTIPTEGRKIIFGTEVRF